MSTVNTNLDNKLFVECPEGFHLLDDEELAAMTFLDDGSKLCMSEPDKHILISISNKRINGFSSMMLKTSDVAGNMIKQIAQGMKPYGFKQLNTVEKIVAGRKAEGLDYEYEAQGIGMSGESLVLKNGKDLYYFHFYCRKETAAAGFEKFREILDMVSIK